MNTRPEALRLAEGARQVNRSIEHYNLDAILSNY
jgi:hypothetical protein